MMRGLLVGALLAVVMPASGALADAVVYTPARGTLCQDRSKPEFGYWICPGPGGYVASFSDEGNLSAVSIARGKARKPATTSEFLGAGRVFGDKVEWHLVDGKPKSAVLRVWRREQMKDGSERELQELQVYAVNSDRACPYAAVNVTETQANEKAAARAEEASRWECPER
jgi:hypothetical protein